MKFITYSGEKKKCDSCDLVFCYYCLHTHYVHWMKKRRPTMSMVIITKKIRRRPHSFLSRLVFKRKFSIYGLPTKKVYKLRWSSSVLKVIDFKIWELATHVKKINKQFLTRAKNGKLTFFCTNYRNVPCVSFLDTFLFLGDTILFQCVMFVSL